MVNEWFTPTDQYSIKNLGRTWDESNKYKTLSEELGFNVNTGVRNTDILSAWTANGWVRGFFDDFDGTPVGQQPANVVKETLPRIGSAPEFWWAMGRGPTGNGASIEPGFTRVDWTTNMYQILSPSVMGLGTVKLPNVPGTTSGSATYSSSMQTERRGPGRVIIADPATWVATNSIAYDQSYGFFECSMKCPRYAGSWPGAWLISSDEYTASTYPRIELDINEVYLSGPAEDGNVHITPWLHRPQTSYWLAPGGFSMQDKLWSSGGLDTRMYYLQGAGAVKKFDDGFHQFGVYLKKDLSAPGGLGWWIWYMDREEIARIPLITEWLRYYYLIISHQLQAPYKDVGFPVPPSPVPGQPPPPPPTYPPMANYDVHWLEVDYWGAWRNPSVIDPPRLVNYVPPLLTDLPTKTISISRLERALSIKSDVKVAGNILLPEHSSTDTPPVMAMQANFTIIEGDAAGTIVGTVTVTNTPTNPVKYRLAGPGADHFAIDGQTGEITTVHTPLVVRDYDLYVIASDTPLTPKIPGSNTTHVLIACKEDAIFGFEYWRGGPLADPVITDLQWWIDAQDPASSVIESGVVTKIEDKSNRDVYREQADLTKCPVLNPTGIGGHPAWETQNANVLMAGPEVISASALFNIVLSTVGKFSVSQGGATPTNTYNFTDPGILFMGWRADPATNPDAVLMSHNGTNLVPFSVSPANKVYTVALAVVYKADSLNATNIGTIHTGLHLFNQADVLTRWYDGKLGEIGILYWPANEGITKDLHERLVGGLAHKWSLTSYLPATHPWKVTVPKLWRTSEWPNVTSTGARGTLTAYSGSMTISTNGVTISDKIITGGMTVQAGVTGFVMRNCIVNYDGFFGIDAEGAVTPLIEDCTFVGPGAAGNANCAYLGEGIVRRCDISQSENGIVTQGTGQFTRNYIHDLNSSLGDAGHYDGIAVQGGQDGILIADNWIAARDTSCVFIKNDGVGQTINDVTVDHNYMTGLVSSSIYVRGDGAGGLITNVTLSRNVIDTALNGGNFDIVSASPTLTGNVDLAGNPLTS